MGAHHDRGEHHWDAVMGTALLLPRKKETIFIMNDSEQKSDLYEEEDETNKHFLCI